jgi:hypothetical protein
MRKDNTTIRIVQEGGSSYFIRSFITWKRTYRFFLSVNENVFRVVLLHSQLYHLEADLPLLSICKRERISSRLTSFAALSLGSGPTASFYL